MAELWFWIVGAMFVTYVVLDGFDLGAGALHLLVARTDDERRQVLGAVGPLWDGNEVWLLAGGGTLFLAFPKVLAAGFSGFYLAMFLVVWCLVGRGIAIEFRSHVEDPLWRAFWDAVFGLSSALLPVLLGTALGNVLRGVPLDASGHFSLALFASGGVPGQPGLLDWYTVLLGVFALVALGLHGALFLAWKTEGPVHDRSLGAARILLLAVLLLWPLVTLATGSVSTRVFEAFPRAPLAWITAALALGGAGLMAAGTLARRPFRAFLGSCAFLAGLLASAAAMVYPVMLPSLLNPAHDLKLPECATEAHGLATGLGAWLVALPLVIAYFVNLYRLHRGKVAPSGY